MTYSSRRGEFPSLQHLRAAYLKDPDWQRFWVSSDTAVEKPWAPELLHASDLGGCPRALAYRLMGAKEKPRSASSAANRTVMFWAGYHFHYLTYSALSWAGLLVTHEEVLELRDGWSGTLDAELRFAPDENTILFDEKTVMPNALNYADDLPKRSNCLQLACYGIAKINKRGIIEYTDRAGQNSPKECPVDLSRYYADVEAEMALAERARDNLPELPETLGQVYVPHYTRDTGDNRYMVIKTIDLETPWNCGYCDYHLTKTEQRINPASKRMKKYGWTEPDSLCKPLNVPPVTVAEYDKSGDLISMSDGHEAGCARVFESYLNRYYQPEDQEQE